METHWASDADNRFSYLVNATPEQAKAVHAALRVRPNKYFFDPRYRIGIWDGWNEYYDLIENRIPTGLLGFVKQLGFDYPEVIKAKDPLSESGWKKDIVIYDPNPDAKQNGVIVPMIYQQESLDKVIAGIRRGVFLHLTAAGKSVLIAMIAAAAANLRILISVPSLALLTQLADDLEKMLREDIGRLGSKFKDADKRVIVAYNGFLKRLERSPFATNLALQTDLLMVDELQTSTKLDYKFYRKCKNAYYRYGFSGSFYDIDPGRIFDTSGYFGPVITEVTDEDTLASNRTVPPNFVFFEYYIRKTIGQEYGEVYGEQIVQNKGFNNFFADIVLNRSKLDKSILILVKRVQHCSLFQEALRERGLTSEIYNGQIDLSTRDERKKDFTSGNSMILIATEQTLGIGVNIPRIQVLVNLGGGDSDDKSKQKYGRSLRSFSFIGKEEVEIIEPFITGNVWFNRHSKHRLAVAKKYKTGTVKLIHLSGHEEICV